MAAGDDWFAHPAMAPAITSNRAREAVRGSVDLGHRIEFADMLYAYVVFLGSRLTSRAFRVILLSEDDVEMVAARRQTR